MIKNKVGRPTDYSAKLAIEICDVIAENMLGLKTLCKRNPHWPVPRTIRDWVRNNKEFSHMYTKAKEDQCDLMAEEILEIADDTSHDFRENDEGKIVANNELVNRSRLRVDSRKWIAAKLKPKFYGEKLSYDVKASVHETSLKDLD